jgi:hypothetical protein
MKRPMKRPMKSRLETWRAWAAGSLCASLVSLQSAGAQTQSPSAFRVVADDVSAAGLVAAVSKIVGANVLVIGDPLRRLTVDATFASAEEFLEAHAKSLGLSRFAQQQVQVLAPAGCAPAAPAPDPSLPPISRETLSVGFSFIEPAWLMAMLADFSDNVRLDPSRQPTVARQIVSLTATLPANDLYALVKSLTGAGLQRQPDGRFLVVERPSPGCVSTQPSARVIDAVISRITNAVSSTCPRKERDHLQHGIEAPRRCDPLERFATDDLWVRGRVEREGSAVALVEAPDGLTYVAKVGDHLGHNDGRIRRVDEAGLTIEDRAAPGRVMKRVLIDNKNMRHLLE